MARINIEDSLWADPRFQELMIRVGNRHTAKGMVLELWTEAQKFWLGSGGRGIPRPAWDESGLPQVLIECGLARDHGEFVYAVGSQEQFAWLSQRSEAGKSGGKASGKTRRETKGKKAKRKEAERIGAKPLTLSLSLTPSLSSGSSSDSEIYSVGERAHAPPAEVNNPVGYFIAAYCKAYKARYGDKARPDLTGKVQGKVKRYIEETPIERACDMIRVYCEMNDPWFLTKCHDFGTFLENLSKVGVALDAGRTLTQGEIRQLDRKQTNLNAWAPIIAEAEANGGQHG